MVQPLIVPKQLLRASLFGRRYLDSYCSQEKGGILVLKLLPIVTILTLAATGSEMNAGAVISNLETNQKLGFGGPNMIPKVSFLDPTNTFTVPKNQTAAGSADIFSHLIENYF